MNKWPILYLPLSITTKCSTSSTYHTLSAFSKWQCWGGVAGKLLQEFRSGKLLWNFPSVSLCSTAEVHAWKTILTLTMCNITQFRILRIYMKKERDGMKGNSGWEVRLSVMHSRILNLPCTEFYCSVPKTSFNFVQNINFPVISERNA